jgi:hypothetical protein
MAFWHISPRQILRRTILLLGSYFPSYSWQEKIYRQIIFSNHCFGPKIMFLWGLLTNFRGKKFLGDHIIYSENSQISIIFGDRSKLTKTPWKHHNSEPRNTIGISRFSGNPADRVVNHLGKKTFLLIYSLFWLSWIIETHLAEWNKWSKIQLLSQKTQRVFWKAPFSAIF